VVEAGRDGVLRQSRDLLVGVTCAGSKKKEKKNQGSGNRRGRHSRT
jgi:hypothetical protein